MERTRNKKPSKVKEKQSSPQYQKKVLQHNANKKSNNYYKTEDSDSLSSVENARKVAPENARRSSPAKNFLHIPKIEPPMFKASPCSPSTTSSSGQHPMANVPPKMEIDTTQASHSKMASKIKPAVDLYGLDAESDIETEPGCTIMKQRGKKRLKTKSPSVESQDRSSSEKESKSLVENEELREKYTFTFKELARQSEQTNLDEQREEYTGLPLDPVDRDCTAFLHAANKKKNRYENIRCLDKSRVRLTFMSKNEPGSDYIHANYVTSRYLKHRYILTQGPKKFTIVDFWRMIWQEKTTEIVMLCNFVEHNREKCSEYFPRNHSTSMKFDKLCLSFEDSTTDKSVVTTKLRLEYNGEKRIITHFQWVEWPDYQVPGSSETMLRLLRKIRGKKMPPVIHCAAGVGRSGTLMAIEIALMAINNFHLVPDFKQIVTSLRMNGRCGAVQTLQQYMLIRKVVLDFGAAHRCDRGCPTTLGIRKSGENEFGDDVSIRERSKKTNLGIIVFKICLGLFFIGFATGCIIYSVLTSDEYVHPNNGDSMYFPYDLSQYCDEGTLTWTNRTGTRNDYNKISVGISWLQDASRKRLFHRIGLEPNDKDWINSFYVFINHSFILDKTGCRRDPTGYDQFLANLGFEQIRKDRTEAFKIKDSFVKVNYYEGEPPLDVKIEGRHPAIIRAYSSIENTFDYGWEYIFASNDGSTGLFRKEYWLAGMKPGSVDYSVFENIPDICYQSQDFLDTNRVEDHKFD
ncbi:unnamed protein product [Caenorhabditis bovis]|uniref:Tyrosine-protein phosphatase domain-containing protein n=1 Tax=Caenorhabditis bovis TaxID=2654633 RepID=A0A8S1EZP1_9PELO|nr:unnamed protein product [Caenorhabditis bovis]